MFYAHLSSVLRLTLGHLPLCVEVDLRLCPAGSQYTGSRKLWKRFIDVFVEAVAEPSNRADQASICRVGLDLPAEPQNVYVDGAIVYRVIVAPHGVEKLLAAVYHARAAHEKIQQPEFAGGNGNFTSVPQHPAVGAV